MARSTPIEFSDYSFATQKEFQQFCTAIRDRWDGHGDLQGDDLQFMQAVLTNSKHYENLITSEIKRIFVDQARVYNTRSFWCEMADGNQFSFSPLKAFKKRPVEERFKAACRHATLPERREVKDKFFAENVEPRCPVTGELLTPDNVDLHHAGATFEELLGQFRQAELSHRDLATLIDDHETLVDKEIEQKWQRFHREHASLEVVSKPEHEAVHQAQ